MSEQKPTPGPWRWYGSPKSGFYLATERHGRRIVMEFERLGMQGAQPSFQVDGLMVAGSELCNFEVAPEIVGMTEAKQNRQRVYRYEITGFNHPDAHLIAAAWEMFNALERAEKYILTLRQELYDSLPTDCPMPDDDGVIDEIRSAISKAKGD